MQSLITLDGLAYRSPDGRTLFENLTLAFGRERTGLVGRNGVGKTTLARLIVGELDPAAGSVTVIGRVASLSQAVSPPSGASLGDLLGVAEPLAALERIERGEGTDADLETADWLLPARLDAALARMGLAGMELGRPAVELSGGQVTRARMAGLLVAETDVIILDEPTNNLDADGREAVAEFLESWTRGALVISHDRDLLRRMERIVELSSLGARVYGGGYDLYAERKAAEAAGVARDLDAAARRVAQVERGAQAAAERKARSDAAGKRSRLRRDMPKMRGAAGRERRWQIDPDPVGDGRSCSPLRANREGRPRRGARSAGRPVERQRDPAGELPPAEPGGGRQHRPCGLGAVCLSQCNGAEAGWRPVRRRAPARGPGVCAHGRPTAAVHYPGRTQQPPRSGVHRGGGSSAGRL